MSLIVDIESYLHRTGIAETTFGRRAVNDPRLVGELVPLRIERASVSTLYGELVLAGVPIAEGQA